MRAHYNPKAPPCKRGFVQQLSLQKARFQCLQRLPSRYQGPYICASPAAASRKSFFWWSIPQWPLFYWVPSLLYFNDIKQGLVTRQGAITSRGLNYYPRYQDGLRLVPRVNELARVEQEGTRRTCQYLSSLCYGQSLQLVWCRWLC